MIINTDKLYQLRKGADWLSLAGNSRTPILAKYYKSYILPLILYLLLPHGSLQSVHQFRQNTGGTFEPFEVFGLLNIFKLRVQHWHLKVLADSSAHEKFFRQAKALERQLDKIYNYN